MKHQNELHIRDIFFKISTFLILSAFFLDVMLLMIVLSVPYISANIYWKLSNLLNTDRHNYSTDLRSFLGHPVIVYIFRWLLYENGPLPRARSDCKDWTGSANMSNPLHFIQIQVGSVLYSCKKFFAKQNLTIWQS